jgi:hypothetical protein
MDKRPDEPWTPPPTTAVPAGATPDPAVADLDEAEVARRRSSPRRRATQAGVVLAVVVVVVGLLLHSIGPSRPGTASVQPLPLPSTLIESNVNYGTLTVNGYTLTGVPPLVTARLHTGTNVVTLAAPPFGPKTCHVLFPSDRPSVDAGGVGDASGNNAFAVNGVRVVPDLVLTIELSSADLPPDLAARASATALLAVAALRPQTQTVVPAGQYYATGWDAQGHVIAQRARAPLHAQVDVRPAGGCGPSPLCPVPLDPGLGVPPSPRVWSVGIALTAAWAFAPPAGSVVSSPPVLLMLPLQLFLANTGAGDWRLVSLPASAVVHDSIATHSLADQLAVGLCQAGSNLLGALLHLHGSNGTNLGTPYERGVEGCIIDVLGGTSAGVQGRFIWRFGVLLAVDQGAHALAPWLPRAPQAEVTTVEG